MAWGGQEKKRAEETILRKLKKCHERAMNINAFLRSRGEQKQKILNVANTEKTSKISIFLQGFGTFPHFEIHQGKKSGQKIMDINYGRMARGHAFRSFREKEISRRFPDNGHQSLENSDDDGTSLCIKTRDREGGKIPN